MKQKIQIVSFAFLLFACKATAQNLEVKESVLRRVFENIVNAYGNAKSPPSLNLVSKEKSDGYPASYISSPIPLIKIEEQVFDICMQMKADSLNALAIIVCHELAHYYNDHTWCSDYSYAIRDTELGQKLRNQSRSDQLKYETQADNHSFYYCCIAGYSPFNIYGKLIDAVYKVYKFPATIPGYPGKEERKMIARKAQEKISRLYPVYDAGLLLLYLNQLQAAESCFDYLAKYFPGREIYNNLGVAKFLKALELKPYDTLNFIYPIDIDPVSRMYQNSTRGGDDANIQYINMLKDAKKQFEKAQSLDPSYISSHINLACVNDALGNYQMALGNIFEAEQLDTNDPVKLKHIKAIVLSHTGNKDTAETLLQTLSIQDSLAAYNYRLLAMAKNTKNDIIAIEKFKDSYAESLKDKTSTTKNCNAIPDSILKGEKSVTKINDRLTIASEIADNYSQIKIDLFGKIIEAMITNEGKTGKEINTSNFRSINQDNGCLIFTGSFTKAISYQVK